MIQKLSLAVILFIVAALAGTTMAFAQTATPAATSTPMVTAAPTTTIPSGAPATGRAQ